jgi:hypothetical protein
VTSQALISGTLLLAVRQTEAQRGQLLAHHGRADHALRPTNTRKSPTKSALRREQKLRNRYRATARVEFQRQPGWYPGYGFPEDLGSFKFV